MSKELDVVVEHENLLTIFDYLTRCMSERDGLSAKLALEFLSYVGLWS